MSVIDIPRRANRALLFIILAFLLIVIRVWYLCFVCHDTLYELAKKPQKKTLIEKPARGTIRDRFNLPLAVNKVSYNVCILYDAIRQLPRVEWSKSEDGTRKKIYPRKEYIQKLSHFLATELDLVALDIEDIFYSKASLFPNTPFVIKDDLAEPLYYKLKALERKFPGLSVSAHPKRFYPNDKMAGDLLGYIGVIDQSSYLNIAAEISYLEEFLLSQEKGMLAFLPRGFSSLLDVKGRLLDLKKRSYSLSDYLGKMGLEQKFDNDLRGLRGKQHYEVNTQGHYVRLLPGSKSAIPGKRLLLNLSSELQQHAEMLLAEHEKVREEKFSTSGKDHTLLPSPWIKGGAIVALIPKTGEIVAMASYPRMNPNDFIADAQGKVSDSKQTKVYQWLENSYHLQQLWDGKIPLEREFYSAEKRSFYQEEKWITLESFLDMCLSKHAETRKIFLKVTSLEIAHFLQKNLATLLDLSEQPHVYGVIDTLYTEEKGHIPSCLSANAFQLENTRFALSQHEELVSELKRNLDPYLSTIKHNDDKLLLFDLIRLVAEPISFSSALFEHIKSDSLSSFRKLTQAYASLLPLLESELKISFHCHDFKKWRDDNFKNYMKERRKEEKEKKTYQKPYIEYLTKLEKAFFTEFFEKNKWEIMHAFLLQKPLSDEALSPHVAFLLEKESRILDGAIYPKVSKKALSLLREKWKNLPEDSCIELLKSFKRFQDLNQKLYGYYPQIKKAKGKQLLKDLAISFYPPTGFGYGRSYTYRQATPLGSIFKVITAYEAIKQNHEKGFYQGKDSLNPLTIIDEVQPGVDTLKDAVLGFQEDGKKITRYYKGGRLPKTRMALGKVDYLKAMERSSNIYFSLLASDVINEPNDLVLTSLKFGFGNKTGVDLPYEIPGVLPKDLSENRSGLYAFAIGQHSLIATPLQTSIMLASLVNGGEVLKPQIVQLKAGKNPGLSLFQKKEDSYSYEKLLNRIGIFFPFFLQTQKEEDDIQMQFTQKTLYRKLYLPDEIKNYLVQSLHNVVASPQGSVRSALIRYLYGNPGNRKKGTKLIEQIAGKTSTAEIAYKPTLDRQMPPIRCKDLWFAGISLKPAKENSVKEEAELVVVVYLKFGQYGKEAAPLALSIIQKWEEICSQHGKVSYLNNL